MTCTVRAQILLLLGMAFAGASDAGPRIFCCADGAGKQVCGDILPTACYGRAYRELGASGGARIVEAPLTSEQKAQKAAEELRRKEQERLVNEQKRKDQALLNTYGSEKDIEAMRSRADRDLVAAIQAAEERIVDIRRHRKRFEDEAEFYKGRQLPADVAKGLRDADHEIGAQQSVIESKNKDRQTVRKKFDDDLRRYVELSKRPPPGRP